MNVDVFISYKHNSSSGDGEFAKSLKCKLEDENVQNIVMDEDFPIGDNWANAISRALEAAHVVVLIISEDSMKSAFVTYEWCYAHFGLSKHLFSIHLGGCGSATGVFGCFERTQLQYKDVHNPATNDEWSQIIREIKRLVDVPDAVRIARAKLVTDHIDNEERINAASELGQHKGLPSRKYLLEALEYQLKPGKGNGLVQKAVVEALSEICSKRDLQAINLLCNLFAHTRDENVQRSIAETLGMLSI
jgi:hypothetical protein